MDAGADQGSGHLVTENELKTAVCRLARENGWSIHHNAQARNIHRSGDNGFPDLEVARDGQVIWMELKDADGILSPEQYRWSLILPAFHTIRPSHWEDGTVHRLLA